MMIVVEAHTVVEEAAKVELQEICIGAHRVESAVKVKYWRLEKPPVYSVRQSIALAYSIQMRSRGRL